MTASSYAQRAEVLTVAPAGEGSDDAFVQPSLAQAASGKARPHILHVFPSFNVGGAQVRFAALAAGMGNRYAHTVLSLSGRFEAAKLLDPALDVRLAEGPSGAASFPQRLKRYRQCLADLSPDLLVTYNWGAIEFGLANAFRATPHLHAEDGFGPEEAIRQFPRRVWTRRLALARSQLVVPSSTLDKIALGAWRLNRAQVQWIPNGIAERDGPSMTLGGLGLELPPGLPIIVWAGALRGEKNPIRLLRAFAPIKDKAVLLLIGDGPERAAVEAAAEQLGLTPHIRLLGYRPDTRDLIMQSQIMALSSDTEQMPLVVLEAMDAGLAVVSTDVGDVRRMVAPENAPFVASSDTDLTAAFLKLIEDAPLRARIGAANRAKCRTDYAMSAMIETYRSLFDRMVGQPAQVRRS